MNVYWCRLSDVVLVMCNRLYNVLTYACVLWKEEETCVKWVLHCQCYQKIQRSHPESTSPLIQYTEQPDQKRVVLAVLHAWKVQNWNTLVIYHNKLLSKKTEKTAMSHARLMWAKQWETAARWLLISRDTMRAGDIGERWSGTLTFVHSTLRWGNLRDERNLAPCSNKPRLLSWESFWLHCTRRVSSRRRLT